MLFSIFPDLQRYTYIGFDREEIRAIYGNNIKNHIDLSSKPVSYLQNWQPLTVQLEGNCDGITGSLMPDVMEFSGRLFLSQLACDVLKSIISSDGEFLPVRYEKGQGYIFNPLSLAEAVGGFNPQLTVLDELRDIERISFHEACIKDYAVFRSEFDLHRSLFCNESVKNAIEAAGLGGVYFTTELGNRFASV